MAKQPSERAARAETRRIGEILADAGKLAAEQVERTLDHRAARGIRFGEAAVELGLATDEDVREALAQQLASAQPETDPSQFGEAGVELGLATDEDIQEALAQPETDPSDARDAPASLPRGRSAKRSRITALVPAEGPRPVALVGERIGEILVALGKLQTMDVTRVLGIQAESGGFFGAIAIRLGLIAGPDLQLALARQFDYPYLVDSSSSVSREVVSAYAPFGKAGEALRGLRSELLTRWFENMQGGKALAIVSPGRGEGRSYLAANLAVTLSQLGMRTLLIDADLRNPRQHAIFGLDNTSGLSAVLSGRGESRALQQVPSFQDLYILPAGVLPPNPQELLARPDFRDTIGALEKEFGAVLVDTPAGVECADARTISASTRGALMVVRKDHTRTQALASFARSLEAATVNVVGTVMMNARQRVDDA